jgi:HAD superfamily hydrolase (TIGR01509 family)
LCAIIICCSGTTTINVVNINGHCYIIHALMTVMGDIIMQNNYCASALLFDMDGTLLTSIPIIERTWRRFALRHKLDHNIVFAYLHGRRTEETVKHFLGDDVDVMAEVAQITQQEISDVDGIVEIPGARALLSLLPLSQWAVVTSASRELALARMYAAAMPIPNILVAAEDVFFGKPAPDGYLLAAQLLGIAADKCIVFEDAYAGLLAAQAAGMRAIAVGSGISKYRFSQQQCFDVHINSYKELAISVGNNNTTTAPPLISIDIIDCNHMG